MNQKAWLVLSLVILAVIALGVAWHNAAAAREAEAALSGVARQRANLVAALRRGDARSETAVRPEETSTSPTTEIKPPQNPVLTLLRSPKMQALMLAKKQRQMPEIYGLLFRKLNLSPDQIAKFEENVMRHEEQISDLAAVRSADPADRPAEAELKQQDLWNYLAAQGALLGDAGLTQLQQYERTLPARGVIDGFAGAAALAGVPLSPPQADQMAQILANASSSFRTGGNVDLRNLDWTAADLQAQKVMSAEQASLFQSIDPWGGNSPESSRFFVQLDSALSRALRPDTSSSQSR